MNIPPASTSRILFVKIVDDNGLPVTNLVAATFPPTFYLRSGALPVSITLIDLPLVNSNYTSGGVFELGYGRYRLDVPDAAFVSATDMVSIFGEASNKHLSIDPSFITNRYMQSDVRQWIGKTPAGVYGNVDGGKLQVRDRNVFFEYSGSAPFTFGTNTIEWGPGGLAYSDDFFVGQKVRVVDSLSNIQVREVINFVNSTGVMTVDRDWDPLPDVYGEIYFYVSDPPTIAERNSLSAVVLRRTMANVEAASEGDTLDEASLYGVVQRASKSSAIAHTNKLTIYQTDGVTELAQIATAADAAANPITKMGV